MTGAESPASFRGANSHDLQHLEQVHGPDKTSYSRRWLPAQVTRVVTAQSPGKCHGYRGDGYRQGYGDDAVSKAAVSKDVTMETVGRFLGIQGAGIQLGIHGSDGPWVSRGIRTKSCATPGGFAQVKARQK
jgi:hypothetical protein